jgi:hypothetical protein
MAGPRVKTESRGTAASPTSGSVRYANLLRDACALAHGYSKRSVLIEGDRKTILQQLAAHSTLATRKSISKRVALLKFDKGCSL